MKNRDLQPITRFISEMTQDRASYEFVLWKANRKPFPSFRMEG